MKADDSSKEGDVLPNQSSSNVEDNRPSTSKRKAEPLFELRPNFSRVTPAQLAHISFSSDGRYQPVRPVSTRSQAPKAVKAAGGSSPGLGSEIYAGGGGILILTDLRPNDETEFIEIETAPPVAAAAPAPEPPSGNVPVHNEPRGHHISLDENAPEAEPPEPFEVCTFTRFYDHTQTYIFLFSTLLIMIHRKSCSILILDLSCSLFALHRFPFPVQYLSPWGRW